jgi:hypothetical protein
MAACVGVQGRDEYRDGMEVEGGQVVGDGIEVEDEDVGIINTALLTD